MSSPGAMPRFLAVLSPKGRTHFEAIAWRGPGEHDSLLLETDAAVVGRVLKLFDRYRVREKVEFSVEDSVGVVHMLPSDMREGSRPGNVLGVYEDAVLDGRAPSLAAAEACGLSDVVDAAPDPRTPVLGHRALVRAPSESSAAARLAYGVARTLCGVPESRAEIADAVPLELNLQQLAGVSFDKGCYVGQELVARAHFRGQLRKRIAPVLLGGRGAAAVAATGAADGPDASLEVGGVVLPAVPGLRVGGEACAEAEAVAAELESRPEGDRLRVQRHSDDDKGGSAPGGRAAGRILGVVRGSNVALAMLRLDGVMGPLGEAWRGEQPAPAAEGGLEVEAGGEAVAVTPVAPPYWQWVEAAHEEAAGRS